MKLKIILLSLLLVSFSFAISDNFIQNQSCVNQSTSLVTSYIQNSSGTFVLSKMYLPCQFGCYQGACLDTNLPNSFNWVILLLVLGAINLPIYYVYKRELIPLAFVYIGFVFSLMISFLIIGSIGEATSMPFYQFNLLWARLLSVMLLIALGVIIIENKKRKWYDGAGEPYEKKK